MDVGYETVFERVAHPLKIYLEQRKIDFDFSAEKVIFFGTNFKFKLKGISEQQLDEITTVIEKLYDEKVGKRI